MQPLSVVLRKRHDIARGLARFRDEGRLVEKIAASGAFALLIALSAQVRIVLPFTPVPFTGEVLAVLLAGFFLGRHAPISVGMYLGMGAAFGWFSGFVGFAAFTSVTAGYLFGFVGAAAIVGALVPTNGGLARTVVVMELASLAILLCGAAWLCVAFSMPLAEAFAIGVLPFLIVDAVKVGIAATVARSLAPGRSRIA